jgi:CheY-like chemotaxis protein
VLETVSLLRASLPSTIELRTDVDGTAGAIWADAHQVHQVVLNLGTNATHAMEPSGGVLDIVLESEILSGAAEDNPGGLAPGRYVRLSVRDTGHGMDPDTVRRAFDPFFTTKEVGRGTGLGLSMVHGIVTAHGGAVTLDSEPGVGTTVHVHLPMAESATHAPSVPAVAAQGDAQVRGRLLLVDDEPEVSRATGKALEANGWTVVAVTTSSEALARVCAQPDAFDAVITDLTMPIMTGPQLAGEVKALRPDIPVLLMSGFGDSRGSSDSMLAHVDGFLRKPSTVREVEAALAKLITVVDSPDGSDARPN